MSLIDDKYFVKYHQKKASDFEDGFITLHIPNAEIEVIDLVGESTFDEIETLAEKENPTTKELRKLNAYRNALSDLTMKSMIPSLSLVVGDTGILQSSENTKSFGDSSFTIPTPSQIQKYQDIFLDKATILIFKDIDVQGSTGVKPVLVKE